MAYLLWKSGRAYIYHDGKCRSALGVLDKKEAKQRLTVWSADNGANKDIHYDERSIESLWSEWMQYMVSEEYSEKTIKCQNDCVKPFTLGIKQLKHLTKAYCNAWNDHLTKSTFKRGSNIYPLSKETRAHRLRAISAFCGWLKRKEYVSESPFKVKIPEGRKDAKRALRGEQVHALFENWPIGRYESHKQVAFLTKLFFKIVFYGGTRLTETLGESDEHPGATYDNIDRANCILRLEKTKAGKSREVALPRIILDEIPKGTGPIFFGKISEIQVRHYLQRACVLAGITGRLRPHDGRVTCATEWARKHRDLKASMDQFGWKDVKMAMEYQQVATEQRIAQAQEITYE